ncbi:MAG: tRNA dihydrouridine synthase DusB [Desulfitobacteriaceae bacterium]
MRLGIFELEHPVFLAPMAGVTDKAFRQTVQAVGGKYAWTEMISDKALVYQNPRTLNMLDVGGEPRPRIVQLFGSEPRSMAQAAVLAEHSGADVIDINMGCPTLKIVRNGEGSALLLDLMRAQEIARAVITAVRLPVSVKIRLGWEHSEIIVLELAQRLESVGVSMLTLHARTREQYYGGKADWEWIKRLKENTRIPVIGNGDIFQPEDARNLLNLTQCDGVMIGRGALGNPWLIPRTEHFLRTGELLPEPSLKERIQVALAHFELVLRYKGERIGLNEMRKHAAWYVKGLKHAAQLREEVMRAKGSQEMREILYRTLE